MASQLKSLFWMLLIFLLLSNLQQHCNAVGDPQVPCLYVFGESLSDDGNNNNRLTLTKANYLPYGVDFPKGPTGRFSNGRNMLDVLAQNLGFDEYIPPFATARGEEILRGVNYASGSAGIRYETGRIYGDIISMDMQLKNYQITLSQINKTLGNRNMSTVEYLSKCIFSVAIGTNDYIDNYFFPQYYTTSRIYTPQQYAVVLNQQLSQQLQTLYKSGARKFALFGLAALGNIPFERSSCGSGSNGSACVDNINNATQLFNVGLKSLVAQLNTNLTNATFIFINVSGIESSPPIASKVANVSCCETLLNLICVPFGKICSNRTNYKYWDGIHPTDAVYAVYGERAYKAQSPSDVYPFDVNQLAQV
ncbi:GDSL esterase/lipase At1g29670-like [Corylus avellana]|uniref:GDSL esterase/lipase At1g29670-like n=1 Tax=Corylus avellana TaxID=13451 RepID=UPI001E1FCE13|nr:GDSL esterase/lipase At1g29670-like [Corylus avellana]